tara:strand:+ start:328 stop:462 length:135 start_codon:yes stop_codon:yes gene_type:complete
MVNNIKIIYKLIYLDLPHPPFCLKKDSKELFQEEPPCWLAKGHP